MSEELKELEKRASLKIITEEEHINRVIRYMLSIPFSHFQKDENRYNHIIGNLSEGFRIKQEEVDKMTLENVLLLIGYEPGSMYFDPPGVEKSRRFNSAGDSYILAIIINVAARKDLRIKEFMHIGLDAYIKLICNGLRKTGNNEHITDDTRSELIKGVEEFKQKSINLLRRGPKWIDQDKMTLGDVINKALSVGGRSWMCSIKPLNEYVSEIIESYELMNSLFMDTIRMPFVRAGRDRFRELVTTCGYLASEEVLNMDYEMCYEHDVVSTWKM